MYQIKLNKNTHNLTLKKIQKSIKLVRKTNNIKLTQVGRRGSEGPPGPPGQGLPIGGDTGEFLVKQSDADYDYDWTLVAPTGDKTYSQSFTNAISVDVAHNLNKRPAVTIIDSSGGEVEGTVTHIDTNNLTIAFSASFTGMVFVN